MKPLFCSTSRPWGIHPPVFSDAKCTRCGWTAPGPVGDARPDAEDTAEMARAAAFDRSAGGTDEALAA